MNTAPSVLTEAEIVEEKSKYTRKIEHPIYEPSKVKPIIPELYNTTKRDSLIKEINEADLFPELKEFLLSAAERHTVFNFTKIADFYAHTPVQYKYLFENSALVIIDFDNAIRNGFVKFQKDVDESRIDYLENILTTDMMLKNKDDVQKKKQKRAEEELALLKSKTKQTAPSLESW